MEEYAPGLYNVKNIIGYTGSLDYNPTVYFKKGNQVGHITQHHDDDSNVGREIGISSPAYSISNSGEGGTAQEKLYGEEYHTSRNPFIPVTSLQEIERLAPAIEEFKNLKERELAVFKDIQYNVRTNVGSRNPVLNAVIHFEAERQQELALMNNNTAYSGLLQPTISTLNYGQQAEKKRVRNNRNNRQGGCKIC